MLCQLSEGSVTIYLLEMLLKPLMGLIILNWSKN